MRLLPSRQSLPWWLLAISIAFNIGFGATYGVKTSVLGTGTPSRGGLGGGTMSLVYLHENLSLTPEQESQIEQINEGLLAAIDALRQELREERIVLSQLLGATDVDEEAVSNQLDAISAAQRDAQELVVDHLLQEKRLLRPDQLEAFNEIIQSRVCPGYGMGGGGRGIGRGQGQGPRGGRGRGRAGGRGGG